MAINFKYTISGLLIVLAIFSGVIVEWQFDKDFTSLKRDGVTLVKERWHVEAERTWFALDSWYDINVKCPKIIEQGGKKTTTRCYYPENYYQQLSRSLIRTKIEVVDNSVIKSVPHYAYGTRGSYAGYVIEKMNFIDTSDIEKFPDSYIVSWKPKDTRNYKLVWRLENVKDLNLPVGIYKDCYYQFGNLKIDLKNECNKLEKAVVKDKDTIWFYFNNQRGNQLFDLGFVDPTHDTPILNSTYELNTTNENLTVHPQNVVCEGACKNITNWRLNGTSIAVLNMPFEKNVTGNNTKDYSGFVNDGTEYFNDSAGNSIDRWNATGGYDGMGAYEFDGEGDYISISDDDSLDFTTQFTFSFWINPLDTSIDGMGIFNHYVSSVAGGFILDFVGNGGPGRMRLALLNSTLYVNSKSYTTWGVPFVDTNEWTYVTIVYNAGNVKFYKNGMFNVNTSNEYTFMTPTNQPFYIGVKPSTNKYFNGTIDDILFFNRSLSADQIWMLYTNRTDMLSSDETSVGDNWSACITPNNLTGDGVTKCSENVTIRDTCACPIYDHNWVIDLDDNCVLNTECNLTGYNMTLSGTGTLTLNNTLYLYSRIGFVKDMIWDRLNGSRIFWGQK